MGRGKEAGPLGQKPFTSCRLYHFNDTPLGFRRPFGGLSYIRGYQQGLQGSQGLGQFQQFGAGLSPPARSDQPCQHLRRELPWIECALQVIPERSADALDRRAFCHWASWTCSERHLQQISNPHFQVDEGDRRIDEHDVSHLCGIANFQKTVSTSVHLARPIVELVVELLYQARCQDRRKAQRTASLDGL